MDGKGAMGGLSALAETANAYNKGGKAAHGTLPVNPTPVS
jgi:hypothetical protein